MDTPQLQTAGEIGRFRLQLALRGIFLSLEPRPVGFTLIYEGPERYAERTARVVAASQPLFGTVLEAERN